MAKIWIMTPDADHRCTGCGPDPCTAYYYDEAVAGPPEELDEDMEVEL